MLNIVLASASPRRKELLKLIISDFKVIVSNVSEENINNFSPHEYVLNLAREKALDVALRLEEESIVIGCDTVVELDGNILQKPKDTDDAYNMLKMLANKTHNVITGVCLVNTLTEKRLSFFETTKVMFGGVSDEEIKKYIETGEPMDKAGAYGIQGYAAKFVKRIEGDYLNIVGLPVYRLNVELTKILY